MHVGLHVAFQFASLRTGMVTQLALVGFLARVASPMNNQITLKLERLAAELTGFRLALCLWWGGAVRRHGRQWRGAQKGRLRTGLEGVGIKKAMHRVGTAR